jgi:23S rRNA (adenine2030-N6)-methyltransferase
MLSYRHGFHAGNAADVLKHSVLLFCLGYLGQKGKPCLYVDTHAGAGSYGLAEGFAAEKREWEKGIGALAAAARERPLPILPARYLDLAGGSLPEKAGAGEQNLPPYPGSPAIMARFLRPGDRLVCFELHPADHLSLEALLVPCRGAEVRREDGFKGLAGLLPPPSRRGCILIDPPYEVKEDYHTLPVVLRGALKRFPQGLYITWYPLLGTRPPGDFAEELMGLYRGSRCRLELRTANPDAPPANSPRGMYGSGLVIYNPPWTLQAALKEALPLMAALLGGDAGGWKLRWEEG